MLYGNLQPEGFAKLIKNTNKCYTIKRIFDNENKISMVQIVDKSDRIVKCMFYDENGRLSNHTVYNTVTGKEIKNVTYKSDGKTVSSIREFSFETGKLMKVYFFKDDGKNLSSMIEYNEAGDEKGFKIFCDDGEVISTNF